MLIIVFLFICAVLCYSVHAILSSPQSRPKPVHYRIIAAPPSAHAIRPTRPAATAAVLPRTAERSPADRLVELDGEPVPEAPPDVAVPEGETV